LTPAGVSKRIKQIFRFKGRVYLARIHAKNRYNDVQQSDHSWIGRPKKIQICTIPGSYYRTRTFSKKDGPACQMQSEMRSGTALNLTLET
jgi:hypothetical protein